MTKDPKELSDEEVRDLIVGHINKMVDDRQFKVIDLYEVCGQIVFWVGMLHATGDRTLLPKLIEWGIACEFQTAEDVETVH